MALLTIPNVRLSGVAATVPVKEESNFDYDWITEQQRRLLVKTTGIEKRRVAADGVTTSDLCKPAAERLLAELGWAKEDINVVVFVSQSRDYFLPATGIILQDRLGFSHDCLAFDISLGCSGYVYGMSVIASMMQSGALSKGLLMVGDISTFSLNTKDKSTYPLFGDAGTCTAFEFDPAAAPMHFNLQSDGSGHEAIIIPDGGLRNPLNDASYEVKELEPGIHRSNRNLHLEGLDVFNFSLREVAPNIRALYEAAGTTSEDYDHFVFHQANRLMNESIRKKLKLESEKVPYSLDEYGNTSSASIPLTVVTRMREAASSGKSKMLFSGFGVGLSWGSVSLETENLVIPELIQTDGHES